MSVPNRFLFILLLSGGLLQAGPVFPSNYSVIFSFAEDEALAGSRMNLAWDGTSYWSVSGGGKGGVREARYRADGSLAASYTPGLDFRSVFTDASGNIYARTFNSRTIYRQTAPGIFTPIASLQDGTLDPQATLVLDGSGTEYLAMSGGTVYRWNLAGTFLSSVSLQGFGTIGTESLFPQSRGLAVWNGYWLTYSDELLSAWDTFGRRLDTTALPSGGTSSDANFGFSVANGMFFVEDDGTWRGYGSAPAGAGPQPLSAEVPEPAVWMLVLAGVGALAILRLRRA